MRENQWKRFRAIGAFVNEMDADIIHLGFELSELVQSCFVLPPIVTVLPIADEFPEVTEIGAPIPIGVLRLIRPPCPIPPERHRS
jgi:hypothetical protein